MFGSIKFNFFCYRTFAFIGRLLKHLDDIPFQCFSTKEGLVFTGLGAILICEVNAKLSIILLGHYSKNLSNVISVINVQFK